MRLQRLLVHSPPPSNTVRRFTPTRSTSCIIMCWTPSIILRTCALREPLALTPGATLHAVPGDQFGCIPYGKDQAIISDMRGPRYAQHATHDCRGRARTGGCVVSGTCHLSGLREHMTRVTHGTKGWLCCAVRAHACVGAHGDSFGSRGAWEP